MKEQLLHVLMSPYVFNLIAIAIASLSLYLTLSERKEKARKRKIELEREILNLDDLISALNVYFNLKKELHNLNQGQFKIHCRNISEDWSFSFETLEGFILNDFSNFMTRHLNELNFDFIGNKEIPPKLFNNILNKFMKSTESVLNNLEKTIVDMLSFEITSDFSTKEIKFLMLVRKNLSVLYHFAKYNRFEEKIEIEYIYTEVDKLINKYSITHKKYDMWNSEYNAMLKTISNSNVDKKKIEYHFINGAIHRGTLKYWLEKTNTLLTKKGMCRFSINCYEKVKLIGRRKFFLIRRFLSVIVMPGGYLYWDKLNGKMNLWNTRNENLLLKVAFKLLILFIIIYCVYLVIINFNQYMNNI